MRRITSAGLLQTMRFDNLNGENPEQELEMYCKKLDMKRTKYVIEEKTYSPAARCLLKSGDNTTSIKRTDIWSSKPALRSRRTEQAAMLRSAFLEMECRNGISSRVKGYRAVIQGKPCQRGNRR